MVEYAFVENGEIVRKGDLPKVWRNTSGLDRLSEEELKGFGFYKVVEVKPDILLHQYHGVPVYEFTGSSVTKTFPIETYSVAAVKTILINRGKSVAEEYASLKYSPQEQLAALMGILPVAYLNTIKDDISSIFNSFLAFRTEVNNCSTYAQLKTVYDAYPALH